MSNPGASYQAAVIGGGMMGAAIGYGLARAGARTLVLDEGDVAFRAAKANMGVVFVQGKGLGRTPYHRWTRLSAERWIELAQALKDETGVDVDLQRAGAMRPCLSDDEMATSIADNRKLVEELGDGSYSFEVVERRQLDNALPGLGPDVVGATYTTYDATTTPLSVLRALHAGLIGRGGTYLANARVLDIQRDGAGFVLVTAKQRYFADRVVIAAGLGGRALAPKVGLNLPVEGERGQLMVTERVKQFLPWPFGTMRQTALGSVMLGRSADRPGEDIRTTPAVLHEMAEHNVRVLPALARLKVVRAWAGLRIMAPDGFPIYDHSESHPGAFTATCHSAVTLAGAHVFDLAPSILKGTLHRLAASFPGKRFEKP